VPLSQCVHVVTFQTFHEIHCASISVCACGDIPDFSRDTCALIPACGCSEIPDLSEDTLCPYLSVWVW
jgi:hypothetical protein